MVRRNPPEGGYRKKPFTSLSDHFIDYLQGLYTRASAFEVSCARVTITL